MNKLKPQGICIFNQINLIVEAMFILSHKFFSIILRGSPFKAGFPAEFTKK
ncbi:MAG: hypothetical protein WBB67_15010 [bacterium]